MLHFGPVLQGGHSEPAGEERVHGGRREEALLISERATAPGYAEQPRLHLFALAGTEIDIVEGVEAKENQAVWSNARAEVGDDAA